jgi:hypothetical protein
MAYVTPKTNWATGNIPVASDLNRIEGNAEANHDAIAAEVIARASADTTLTNDLNTEIASRISVDGTKAPLPSGREVIIAYGNGLKTVKDLIVGQTVAYWWQYGVAQYYRMPSVGTYKILLLGSTGGVVDYGVLAYNDVTANSDGGSLMVERVS